jgi:putative flippase GtrA
VSVLQFIRFALVGAVATGIQYVILFILVHWGGVDAVVASSTGFIISSFANYFLNYHFTFRSNQRHGLTIIKFMTLAGIGLVLNSIIMQALTKLGLHYLIAQMCATAGVLLSNFIGNSLWTFRPVANNEDGTMK